MVTLIAMAIAGKCAQLICASFFQLFVLYWVSSSLRERETARAQHHRGGRVVNFNVTRKSTAETSASHPQHSYLHLLITFLLKSVI